VAFGTRPGLGVTRGIRDRRARIGGTSDSRERTRRRERFTLLTW
jgi:hypothetical protein